jgi:4-hydroxybenzoate polyprenyltransferase
MQKRRDWGDPEALEASQEGEDRRADARWRYPAATGMETITSEHPTIPEDPAGGPAVVPRRSPLRAAIKTGRPQEWIKNVFVFAGLLFSGKFNQSHEVLEAVLTFISFCAISSAGYYVNDLVDVELDRQHPKKRFRPLAAGELSQRTAMIIPPLLAAAAIALAFAAVNWQVGLMVIGYGIAQMAYSFGLKQIVIIDVMTLAGLFILRVAAGASAVDAHASEWLLLCTGMIALFLGFTKRRQEAVSELHQGTSSRPVLEHYSLPFLDQMVALVTTGTVISYSIYAVNSPIIGNKMMWTIPPMVYGIFRYLYLIYDRADDRSIAAMVSKDRGMIAAGATFVVVAFALLYIFK